MENNLNKILKAKNKKYIENEINKKNIYEFLYDLKGLNFNYIRKLNIGFKKKIYYFLINVYLSKRVNKYYWIFVSIGFLFLLLSFIPFLSDVSHIINLIIIIIIYSYIFIALISIYLEYKVEKYHNKIILKKINSEIENMIKNEIENMIRDDD